MVRVGLVIVSDLKSTMFAITNPVFPDIYSFAAMFPQGHSVFAFPQGLWNPF